MAQSTPINSYCSRASFRCAYMHHIEKYVFQQKFCAPGSGLLLVGSGEFRFLPYCPFLCPDCPACRGKQRPVCAEAMVNRW